MCWATTFFARTEGGRDLAVDGERGAPTSSIAPVERAEGEGHADPREAALQRRTAGSIDDRGVERAIELQHRAHIVRGNRRGERLAIGLECGDQRRRAAIACDLCCGAFEQRADPVAVDYLGDVEPLDNGAASRQKLQDATRFQRVKCLAYRRTTEAEIGSQTLDREALLRLDTALEDRLANSVARLIGEAERRTDLRDTHAGHSGLLDENGCCMQHVRCQTA